MLFTHKRLLPKSFGFFWGNWLRNCVSLADRFRPVGLPCKTTYLQFRPLYSSDASRRISPGEFRAEREFRFRQLVRSRFSYQFLHLLPSVSVRLRIQPANRNSSDFFRFFLNHILRVFPARVSSSPSSPGESSVESLCSVTTKLCKVIECRSDRKFGKRYLLFYLFTVISRGRNPNPPRTMQIIEPPRPRVEGRGEIQNLRDNRLCKLFRIIMSAESDGIKLCPRKFQSANQTFFFPRSDAFGGKSSGTAERWKI